MSVAIGQDILAGHIQNTMPIGSVVSYAGAVTTTIVIAGAGTATGTWLACTGTAVSRATYADLFAVIGTTWGAGNGSTTFNLPDLRGRVPLGAGTGAGDDGSGTGTPTGTALAARVLGEWGGSQNAIVSGQTTNGDTGMKEAAIGGGSGLWVDTMASSARIPITSVTKSIVQPFLVLNFIIRATYN